MSRFDYEQSRAIEVGMGAWEPSFAALIMAAIRRADTGNYRILCGAFPEIAGELQARYNAPGGYLPGDPDVPEAIQQAWDEPEPDEASFKESAENLNLGSSHRFGDDPHNPRNCDDCGHRHSSAHFGGVCIGCPCEWRPPPDLMEQLQRSMGLPPRGQETGSTIDTAIPRIFPAPPEGSTFTEQDL